MWCGTSWSQTLSELMKSTRATTKRGGISLSQRSKTQAVNLTNLKQNFKVDKKRLILQVKKILAREKKRGELEIVLAGDTLLRHLNKEFAGKSKTTDVLSFPFGENLAPQKGLNYIGEIYISLEQAKRQAKEYGVTLDQELLRLATHGTLHLLGYDHKKKAEAKIMREKEEKYLYA